MSTLALLISYVVVFVVGVCIISMYLGIAIGRYLSLTEFVRGRAGR